MFRHSQFITLLLSVLFLKKCESLYEVDLATLPMAVKCKFQPVYAECGEKGLIRSYYYNLNEFMCMETKYGHCKDDYNNFENRNSCSVCRDEIHKPVPALNMTPNILCRLQPQYGDCLDYNKMFYYDINTESCHEFFYSGCGGTDNRFYSAIDCMVNCNVKVRHEPID